MKKTIKVTDAVNEIATMLAAYPIPGKRGPDKSLIGGHHVFVRAYLAFGIEAELTVTFEPDPAEMENSVIAKTMINFPSCRRGIEDMAALLGLLNSMHALGSMVNARAKELAKEINPKSFYEKVS